MATPTSSYAERNVVLSTLNPQRGKKVMSRDQTNTASDDIYTQTYAVNAERYTRDEWLHKSGPASVRHQMEKWLASEAVNPYNDDVPARLFDRIERSDHAASLSAQGRRVYGVSDDDVLTFAEVEELFWEHYPEDVLDAA
jgi:hypothetical protein